MSTLSQSLSGIKYYMGWYGDCSQDPNSTTGSCDPFEIKDEAKIKLVWEMSDGIKSFSSENPNYSPIQQMEAGKCYMIAVEAGDGSFDIPHFVTSGNGGYVSASCPIGNYFVTTEAYTLPYTTPVVDTGYGYYPVQYSPGDTVTLTANTREGYQFQGWTSLSPFSLWSEVTDVSSPTISFTMPSEPVTVKLDYLDLNRDTDGDGIPDHLDDYPNQSPQIIDWMDTDLSLLTVGDTAELKATAETDITYTISDSSVATLSGNILTVIADGTAEVTATAVESASYFTATATTSFQTDADSDGDGIPDSQDDSPYQQSQTIEWEDDLSNLTVGDTFTLTASAQTAVTYTSQYPGYVSINGNTLTALDHGASIAITATAESSDDYFSATSNLIVNVGQSIEVNPVITRNSGDDTITVSFTQPFDSQFWELIARTQVSGGGVGIISSSQTDTWHTLWQGHGTTFPVNASGVAGEEVSFTIPLDDYYASSVTDLELSLNYTGTANGGGQILLSKSFLGLNRSGPYNNPLSAVIKPDGDIEVTVVYPDEYGSFADRKVWKVEATFYEDQYHMVKKVWRPDSQPDVGSHPVGQAFTFNLSERPEFINSYYQSDGTSLTIGSDTTNSTYDSHNDSFIVYHTANLESGSNIYGSASSFYYWDDYVSSTRIKLELVWDDHEDGVGSQTSLGESIELDLPTTNGVWDLFYNDPELEYALNGDMISGSFKYYFNNFANFGGSMLRYDRPSLRLKWVDPYNGSSSRESQFLKLGNTFDSYTDGDVVNFDFNANHVYAGTANDANYRHTVFGNVSYDKTIEETNYRFQFGKYEDPSSSNNNYGSYAGGMTLPYNPDNDGDGNHDSLDVYSFTRENGQIRIEFPYRSEVAGIDNINQDYILEVKGADPQIKVIWSQSGASQYYQGGLITTDTYTDGETISVLAPLPSGININDELRFTLKAGTDSFGTPGYIFSNLDQHTLPQGVGATGYIHLPPDAQSDGDFTFYTDRLSAPIEPTRSMSSQPWQVGPFNPGEALYIQFTPNSYNGTYPTQPQHITMQSYSSSAYVPQGPSDNSYIQPNGATFWPAPHSPGEVISIGNSSGLPSGADGELLFIGEFTLYL